MTKFAQSFQQRYPGCHIRMDVTQAGLNAYQIKLTVMNAQSETIYTTDVFGYGDLHRLKEQALQQAGDALALH